MRGGSEVLGIVVGHVDYGEADRIVHLLTPEQGRVAAMARGARKSRKRFGGALDLGNRIRTHISRGKGGPPGFDGLACIAPGGRPPTRSSRTGKQRGCKG